MTQKKRIFLLDDSMKRLQRFQRLFQPHEIVHSASAQEANEILAEQQFDLILLDHDLHEHDTNWIASGTGLEVAEFLGSANSPNNETLIVVHSMNPSGVDKMLAALQTRRVRRVTIIELVDPKIVISLLANEDN